MLAQQGVDFSLLFTAKFAAFDLGGFSPRLREPSGVSTEGGRQAMQHLVLQPADGGAANVITAGQVNVVTKQVRIRSYECLLEMHTRRFKDRPFPLAKDRYQEFFDASMAFMKGKQMQVEIESRPPDVGGAAATEPAAQSGGISPWILVAVGVAVVAGIALIALR